MVAPEQMFDQSIVPNVGLEFTVQSRHGGAHNKVVIFTDLKNFRNRVRIETSQDGVRWSVARNDGAIFNFSQDGREFSSTSVEYPVSRRPFLRATIFGWTKNGSVTGRPLITPNSRMKSLKYTRSQLLKYRRIRQRNPPSSKSIWD